MHMHPWTGMSGTITIRRRGRADETRHGLIVAIGPDYEEYEEGPGNYLAVYMLCDGVIHVAPLHCFKPDDPVDAQTRLYEAGRPQRIITSG